MDTDLIAAPMRRVEVEALRAFATEAFRKEGVREDIAMLTANGLVDASARGTDSHGIRLLPHYLRAAAGGRINKNPNFRFEQTAASAGRFDADHAYGHAAGIEAIRKAMQLADQAGTGHVAVYNSSHNGAMSYYSLEAATRGYIGMSYTHATALMNTPGSTRQFFGTNPMSMAVPMEGESPFCYDAAPTKITWNKVKQLKENGETAPPLSGTDGMGNETRDPHEMEQLLPIGDYKGFGLTMMVDILCGLLTGMPAGKDITNMYADPITKKRHLGQFYSVFRIDVFQDPGVFKKRMRQLVEDVRALPRKKGVARIMVPGDPEKIALADRREHGIPLSEHTLGELRRVGEKYRIPFPPTL